MKIDNLPPKQRRFVEEYLKDLNGTQAAIRAGYSERSACEQAAKLLAKGKVKDAVDELTAERSKRTEVTQDAVVQALSLMAFFDPADLPGCPESIKSAPENVRRAVIGWSWSQTGQLNVKFAKERALEMLGRHLGMFKDTVKIEAGEGLAEALEKARRRARGGE